MKIEKVFAKFFNTTLVFIGLLNVFILTVLVFAWLEVSGIELSHEKKIVIILSFHILLFLLGVVMEKMGRDYYLPGGIKCEKSLSEQWLCIIIICIMSLSGFLLTSLLVCTYLKL